MQWSFQYLNDLWLSVTCGLCFWNASHQERNEKNKETERVPYEEQSSFLQVDSRKQLLREILIISVSATSYCFIHCRVAFFILMRVNVFIFQMIKTTTLFVHFMTLQPFHLSWVSLPAFVHHHIMRHVLGAKIPLSSSLCMWHAM